jgi:Zn-dependent peptidase ImmA (M78 family)
MMLLPKKMKIGKKTYAIITHHKPGARHHGHCFYDLKTIQINTAAPPAEVRDTLWHEVTHAILKDMEHRLHGNERFVADFSSRLSKAIDSAKF